MNIESGNQNNEYISNEKITKLTEIISSPKSGNKHETSKNIPKFGDERESVSGNKIILGMFGIDDNVTKIENLKYSQEGYQKYSALENSNFHTKIAVHESGNQNEFGDNGVASITKNNTEDVEGNSLAKNITNESGKQQNMVDVAKKKYKIWYYWKKYTKY